METKIINKRIVGYFLLVLVYAVGVVLIGRMGGAFGLVKHFGLWLGFFLLVRHRHILVEWLLHSHSSTLVVYLLCALPLMLFEENINCLPSGCHLIPVTIPFLVIFLVLIYGIIRMTKVRALWYVLVPACSVGLLWELTWGVSGSVFRALPLPWFIYIALWTWMSYAFFTIVPVQYLLRRSNRLANK